MAQTWTWNETVNISGMFSMDVTYYTYNDPTFMYQSISLDPSLIEMCDSSVSSSGALVITAYRNGAWLKEGYRTMTFVSNIPSQLLLILQENAVKQPTDYLTTDTDITKVADAIRSKTGSTNALVFPDGFVEAIGNIPTGAYNITTTDNADGSQNLAIVDAGGGSSELTPATLTINSMDSATSRYAYVLYFGTDGEIHLVDIQSPITMPLTINTVMNSAVVFQPSGWGGTQFANNNVGCIHRKLQGIIYIVPTDAAASINIYTSD